jgi:hypothetical protein
MRLVVCAPLCALIALMTTPVIPAIERTHVAQACHPSYEGECVPITSDAECAGGSGNGPAYVYGRVRVVGPDEYGLDRDGDGIACER